VRTVLFVCVENSFRSQIAEAYFNRLAPQEWRAVSAGIRPAERVHPNAVKLMAEEGIDIGKNRPRLLTRELQENAELAVIVCSGSECPVVYARHLVNLYEGYIAGQLDYLTDKPLIADIDGFIHLGTHHAISFNGGACNPDNLTLNRDVSSPYGKPLDSR
jgi:protein-tyrosine-phosphatase